MMGDRRPGESQGSGGTSADQLAMSANRAFLAGRLVEMERLYAQALDRNPSAAWIHGDFASKLKKMSRHSEAVAHYLTAHELDPASPDILLSLSLTLREAGNLSKAIEVLNRSLDRNPGDARAWNQLGSCHRDTGNLVTAQACFHRAVDIDPGYLVAANNLANTVQTMGDYNAAAQLFEQAVRINPSHATVWINYGNCLSLMGRFQHAISAYQRAVTADPGDAVAHFALNKTILEAGDRAAFLQSLHACPGWERDGDMLRQVARLEALASNHQRAVQLLSAATAAAPDDAALWLELADAAISAGRADIAHHALEMGASQGKSSAVIAIAAADLAKRAGQDAQALQLVENLPDTERWRPSYMALVRSLATSSEGADVQDRADICVRRVETPNDYASVEALNAALDDLLTGLHTSSVAPVGQSVFSGTQTLGSLWGRPARPLAALKRVLVAAVSDYLADRRAASRAPYWTPPLDGFALVDGWSIRVDKGGGHAEHIHPDGWISGVYYVCSPEKLWFTPDNGGWLTLRGGAGQAHSDPILHVPPLPGTLVLFPSYLHHSVTEQLVEGARIVVAFDVVPAASSAAT